MRTPRTLRRASPAIALLALLQVGCNEDRLSGPSTGAATTVEPAPFASSSEVGVPMAKPVGVRVLDHNGKGVPRTEVRWSVVDGGGSVDAGNGFTPARSWTDDSGLATVSWTLGPEQGVNTLQAWVHELMPLTFAVQGIDGERARVLTVNGVPNDGRPLVTEDSIAIRLEVVVPSDEEPLSEFRLFLMEDTTFVRWPAPNIPLTADAMDELGIGIGFREVAAFPGQRDTIDLVTHLTPPGQFMVAAVGLKPLSQNDFKAVTAEPVKITTATTDVEPPLIELVVPTDTLVTGDSVLTVEVAAHDRGMYEIAIVFDWSTVYDRTVAFAGCTLWHTNSWDWPNTSLVTSEVTFPLCRLRPGRPHPVVVTARDAAFNVAVDTFNIWYIQLEGATGQDLGGQPVPALVPGTCAKRTTDSDARPGSTRQSEITECVVVGG